MAEIKLPENYWKVLISIFIRVFNKYGACFVFWVIVLLIVYYLLFEFVSLESVIFTLIAFSLILSFLTKKVSQLIFYMKNGKSK